MLILQSLSGLFVFLGIAVLFSEDRGRIPWRTVLIGLGLQLALAVLLLKLPLSRTVFDALNKVVLVLNQATAEGTSFVFGYLGGAEFPADVSDPARTFILAFQALPTALFTIQSRSLTSPSLTRPIVRNSSRDCHKSKSSTLDTTIRSMARMLSKTHGSLVQ